MHGLFLSLTLMLLLQVHGPQAAPFPQSFELFKRLDEVKCPSDVTFFSPPTNDDCGTDLRCFQNQTETIKTRCTKISNARKINELLKNMIGKLESDHSKLDCPCKEEDAISYKKFNEKLKTTVRFLNDKNTQR